VTLFPYFGSKRRAAADVWALFSPDPVCYIEPFAGSLAVLLNRPNPDRARCEIAVDLDGLLVNFWRTVQRDPERLCRLTVGPVAETDIHAWNSTLIRDRSHVTEQLRADPVWHDTTLAAWWWMGASAWLGQGWTIREARQRPHVDRTLKGAFALGMTDERVAEVSARLAQVELLAGDWQDAWTRSVTPSIIRRFKTVAVFLDPPYTLTTGRTPDLYASDVPLTEQVTDWCLSQPEHVQTVVAGYLSEYPRLIEAGWAVKDWRAPNGYASTANARRQTDTLIVSPSCPGWTPQPMIALPDPEHDSAPTEAGGPVGAEQTLSEPWKEHTSEGDSL